MTVELNGDDEENEGIRVIHGSGDDSVDAVLSPLTGSTTGSGAAALTTPPRRSVEERREEPRDTPLSHDIGTICAGLAAAPMDENWKNALHNLDSNAEVALTKSAFPALCKPYSVFFTPSDNFM